MSAAPNGAGAGPAVVWDFGGVLFRWRPPVLLSQVLPHRAATPEAAQALARAIFQDDGGDWMQFDRGLVDVPELAQRIASRLDFTLDEALSVIDAVPSELEPMPASVAVLDALHRAGVPLYFLSNMPLPYAEHLERLHPFLGRFDGGLFSARVKHAKPDREIFELAQQRFGRPASQLLFIDDHMPNIESARTLGWGAIPFQSAGQLEAELRSRGLLD